MNVANTCDQQPYNGAQKYLITVNYLLYLKSNYDESLNFGHHDKEDKLQIFFTELLQQECFKQSHNALVKHYLHLNSTNKLSVI